MGDMSDTSTRRSRMRRSNSSRVPPLSVCVVYRLRHRVCLGLLLHFCPPPPPLLLIVIFAQSLIYLLPSALAHPVRRCLRLLYAGASCCAIAHHPHHLCLRLCLLSCRCLLFLSAPASCGIASHQPAVPQPPPTFASPVNGWLLCLRLPTPQHN